MIDTKDIFPAKCNTSAQKICQCDERIPQTTMSCRVLRTRATSASYPHRDLRTETLCSPRHKLFTNRYVLVKNHRSVSRVQFESQHEHPSPLHHQHPPPFPRIHHRPPTKPLKPPKPPLPLKSNIQQSTQDFTQRNTPNFRRQGMEVLLHTSAAMDLPTHGSLRLPRPTRVFIPRDDDGRGRETAGISIARRAEEEACERAGDAEEIHFW